ERRCGQHQQDGLRAAPGPTARRCDGSRGGRGCAGWHGARTGPGRRGRTARPDVSPGRCRLRRVLDRAVREVAAATPTPAAPRGGAPRRERCAEVDRGGGRRTAGRRSGLVVLADLVVVRLVVVGSET